MLFLYNSTTNVRCFPIWLFCEQVKLWPQKILVISGPIGCHLQVEHIKRCLAYLGFATSLASRDVSFLFFFKTAKPKIDGVCVCSSIHYFLSLIPPPNWSEVWRVMAMLDMIGVNENPLAFNKASNVKHPKQTKIQNTIPFIYFHFVRWSSLFWLKSYNLNHCLTIWL